MILEQWTETYINCFSLKIVCQETKLRPACYLRFNEIGNGTKNANIVVIRHGHKSDLRHQNNNNRKWTPNFQTLIMIHHWGKIIPGSLIGKIQSIFYDNWETFSRGNSRYSQVNWSKQNHCPHMYISSFDSTFIYLHFVHAYYWFFSHSDLIFIYCTTQTCPNISAAVLYIMWSLWQKNMTGQDQIII